MSDTKYSVKSGFYDAINHDRLYSADDMNQPYKEIMTEGIDADGFAVTPQSTPDMTINVAAGHAFLGGKWVDAVARTLTVPENTAMYGRYDAVVLQVDTNSDVREASIVYRTGTPAAIAEIPALINTGGISEVMLAYITVAAGATSISTSYIHDTRGGSDCPYADIKLGQLVREQQITDDVTSWLAAHVDPVGSAVVVDNTLSIEGAAADAKATGDALADFNNDFDNIYSSNIPISAGIMENGKFIYYGNGERVGDSGSACSGLISVLPNSKIKVSDCYLVGNRSICCYNEVGDFVSCLIYNSQATETTVTVPSNAYALKVTSPVNVTPTLSYVSVELQSLKDLSDDVFWRVTKIARPIRTDGKYIHYSTGNPVSDDASAYSDFISVNPSSRIRVSACFISGNRSICCYDAEKNYLSALAYGSTDTVKDLTIPDNAFYIRVTTKIGVSAFVSYLSVDIDAIYQLYKAIRIGNEQLSANMTSGKYVSYSLGTLVNDDGSAYSDFIEVKPDSVISVYGCYLVGNRSICCYGQSQDFISCLSPIASADRKCVVTIPSNAHYIRITGKVGENVYLYYDSIELEEVGILSNKVDELLEAVDDVNQRVDNLDLENVEIVIEKLNEVSETDISNVSECLGQVNLLKREFNADSLGHDKECVVTFLNDDGSTGQYYDLYPIMSELNCPYSQCIYTGQYDIQTVEMMENVIALGGDIGSHTVTHPHLMQLTEAELIEEMRDSKAYFTSRGIPCDYIVYPHGESNDLVRMVAKRYYDFGVSAEDRYNEYPIEDFAIKRQTLGSYAEAGHDTYEWYKSLVDHAIANDQWLVFMLHSNYVDFDEEQKQHLRDIIAYIRTQNVKILSMTNAYKLFGNAVKIGDNSTGTSGRGSTSKHFVISKWGDFSTNIFTWTPPSN